MWVYINTIYAKKCSVAVFMGCQMCGCLWGRSCDIHLKNAVLDHFAPRNSHKCHETENDDISVNNASFYIKKVYSESEQCLVFMRNHIHLQGQGIEVITWVFFSPKFSGFCVISVHRQSFAITSHTNLNTYFLYKMIYSS